MSPGPRLGVDDQVRRKRRAISRRGALRCETMVRAPRALATAICMQPMGPAPMINTVSAIDVPSCSWVASTLLSGSERAAWLVSRPAGTWCTMPRVSAAADSGMYSARPPGCPGVMPIIVRWSHRL